MNKAIVFTSFGVADPEARARSIDSAAKEIAAAYPDYEVVQAYTSEFTRKRINDSGGVAKSLSEVLDELLAKKVDRALVQPSHLTPGEEYDNKILAVVNEYQAKFSWLKAGEPVFYNEVDYKKVLNSLLQCLKYTADEAMVLLGHGSPHRHNPVYEKLQALIDEQNLPIFVGVVEKTDTPDFSMVMARLQKTGKKKVFLAPLLLAGGVHVNKDMAGAEPESWKSRLEADGFTVRTNLRGLGEYPEYRQLYLDKISKMLKDQ